MTNRFVVAASRRSMKQDEKWAVVAYCIDPRCPCEHKRGEIITRAPTKREAQAMRPKRRMEYRYAVERT